MGELISQLRMDAISPWIYVAGAGVVVLLLLLLAPRLRHHDESNDGAKRLSLAQQRSVERDMQNLLHELSDMARRVGGELDARANRLAELIRLADERLARLDEATRCLPVQRGNGEVVAANPAAESSAETDARHEQIYSLNDVGLTSHQIAERLHRAQGEVELIIALRPRRRDPAEV